MDRHMLLRLLLHIVSLLSFASFTLPARLHWKSIPYDHIPIGQPSLSSNVTPSLNMAFGQLPSSSLSVVQVGTVKVPAAPPSAVPYVAYAPQGPPPPTVNRVTYAGPPDSNPTVVYPKESPPPTAGSVSPSPSSPPSRIVSSNESANITNKPVAPSLSPSPSTLFAQPSHPHPPMTADITPSAGSSRGGLSLVGKFGIAIAVIVVLLVILAAVIKGFNKKKTVGTDIRACTRRQLPNPTGNSLEEEGIDIRTYTREELANATDNFTSKVGQGVSGFVYRATLPDNRIGAVKRATDLDSNLFKKELSVLLRLPRHPHLVDLIGLCLQEGERILVFEFISNGSLYDRLHTETGLASPLSWAARMDIAYQVAVALQYLHEEAKPPILHRDVKSANVLLGHDNCAKLADFGLSKLGPKDNQFTVTAVRGSYGYMDPQYVRTRRFSAKSDVYSFGVLLLELITGLKSLHEDTPLAEWTETYRLSEGIDIFMTIVDRNMIDHINTMELQTVIKIANLCLRDISEERSSMRQIVTMMQESRSRKANGNLSDGGEAHLLGNGNLTSGSGTAL